MAHFRSIFPIFWAKKITLENLALSRTTSYGFLAPCQNLEKFLDTIERKGPDRRKDGRKEGWMDRPYFIGPFWVPPGSNKGSGNKKQVLATNFPDPLLLIINESQTCELLSYYSS